MYYFTKRLTPDLTFIFISFMFMIEAHISKTRVLPYIWLECIFQYKNMELKVGTVLTHFLEEIGWVYKELYYVLGSWSCEPVGWAAGYGHKEPYSSIHIGVHQLSKGYLMQWVQVCSNMLSLSKSFIELAFQNLLHTFATFIYLY